MWHRRINSVWLLWRVKPLLSLVCLPNLFLQHLGHSTDLSPLDSTHVCLMDLTTLTCAFTAVSLFFVSIILLVDIFPFHSLHSPTLTVYRGNDSKKKMTEEEGRCEFREQSQSISYEEQPAPIHQPHLAEFNGVQCDDPATGEHWLDGTASESKILCW